MKQIFIVCLVLLSATVQAQQKATYTAIIEGSLLTGSSDKANAMLFTSGVAYKNTTVSAGIGSDTYLYRSVPLFLDIRKRFGTKTFQPFAGAAAGINISHLTDAQKLGYFYRDNFHIKNGLYTKAFAGISVAAARNIQVFGNIGYSYKTVSLSYDSYLYNYYEPAESSLNHQTETYRMNRWFFGAGFWLSFAR